MREAGRIDEGVRDHRRLQFGETVYVVDSQYLDRPIQGPHVFKERVLDGMIDRRRSIETLAAGTTGRSEEL